MSVWGCVLKPRTKQEVEAPNIMHKHIVAPCPGYVHSGRKLADVLFQICSGELSRTLLNMRSERARKGRRLGGRDRNFAMSRTWTASMV